MSEYSEEQIRNAMEACACRDSHVTARDLIQELQRPKVEFAKGEVLRAGESYWRVLCCGNTGDDYSDTRTLTPTEHGPGVQGLVETLEAIAAESEMKIPTGNGWTYTYSEMAATALEAYRSRHHE